MKGWPCTLQKAAQLAGLAEGHVAVQCLVWTEKTSAPAHVSGPRSVAEKFKKSSMEIQKTFNSQFNIFFHKKVVLIDPLLLNFFILFRIL